ncbi:hypothetical protein HK405_003240 [Cladochytrium tenue]|nr:hypothetical protein HK405_003240 [Cladochytrium tenue]
MATSDVLDSVFFGFAMAAGTLLTAVTGYRLAMRRSFFDRLCCSACALFTVTQVASVVYARVAWLAPGPRYVLVYLPINVGYALVYWLYCVRLEVFFRSPRASAVFSQGMWALLALYTADTLALVVVFYLNAENTESGGYTVNNGPGVIQLKVASYLIDMIIGILIIYGTVVALLRIIAETEALRTASLTAETGVVFHQGSSTHSSSSMSQSQQQQPPPPPPPPRSLPAHSQSDFYRILLASDILKFVFVFAIEVYKAATSFDPTNQPGALPISNNSFQHVLDSIKMCIMVGNLLLPSGIAKVVKRSSGGSSGAGSKAATAGRAVAAAAPSSSRSDGTSTSAPAAKLGVWGKSPAPAVTTTTASRPPSPPFAAQAGYGHPTKSSGRGGVRRSGSVGDALELYSMSAVDSNTLPGNGSTVDGGSGFGGKGNSTRPTSLSMPVTTQTDGSHRYPAYQIPAQRGIYGGSGPASGHAGYAGGSGTILPVALEQHRDRGLGRGHGGAYTGSGSSAW